MTRKNILGIVAASMIVGSAVFFFAHKTIRSFTTAFENVIPPQFSFASMLYDRHGAPSARAETRTVSAFPLLPETSPPQVPVRAFAVIDAESGVVLAGNNIESVTPIASLTKLMTALVVFDADVSFDTETTLRAEDARPGGQYLHRGERVTIHDLLITSLMGSSNSATIALARSTGLSISEFVERMNAKALELNLRDTTFVEPTGLEAGNVSTALDLARLAREAFVIPAIRDVVTVPSAVIRTRNTGRRIRIENTDELLSKRRLSYTIIGGKTGFTDEAGYSFVVFAEDAHGRGLFTLVLGGDSNESRFSAADTLTRWAFGLND